MPAMPFPCAKAEAVAAMTSAAERIAFLFFKQKTAYEMRISDWSSDVCSSDLTVDSGRGLEGSIFGEHG